MAVTGIAIGLIVFSFATFAGIVAILIWLIVRAIQDYGVTAGSPPFTTSPGGDDPCREGMCMVLGAETDQCIPWEYGESGVKGFTVISTQDWIDYWTDILDSSDPDLYIPGLGEDAVVLSSVTEVTTEQARRGAEILYASNNAPTKNDMMVESIQLYKNPDNQPDDPTFVQQAYYLVLDPSIPPTFMDSLTAGAVIVQIPEAQGTPNMRFAPEFCSDPPPGTQPPSS